MGKTNKEQHSVKAILKAIESSGGIKQIVAKKLGVSRHTVTSYQRKHPTIAQALQNERDILNDKAESNIFTMIQDGDIVLSQWLLRYKGGYVEKSEHKVDEVRRIIFEDADKKDTKEDEDNKG